MKWNLNQCIFPATIKHWVGRIRYASVASGYLLLQGIIQSNQQNIISQASAVSSPHVRINTLNTVKSGVIFLTENDLYQNTECSIIQLQKACQRRQ